MALPNPKTSTIPAARRKTHFSTDSGFADQLDRDDELAHFRSRLLLEDPDFISLHGSTLGRLCWCTAPFFEPSAGTTGKESRPCLELEAKIARLVGAQPEEIRVVESNRLSLFKLAAAALAARPGRSKLVTDRLSSQTLQDLVRFLDRGHGLEWVGSKGTLEEALQVIVDANTALVSLSHVSARRSILHPMAGVTRLTHTRGALVLWDLSHSVGAVPIELNACGADLAIGRTYQRLQGLDELVFLYVRQDLQNKLLPVWDGAWTPAGGVGSLSSIFARSAKPPPKLSTEILEPTLDLLIEARIDRLRRKSRNQTEYLIFLADRWLASLGFTLASPRHAQHRGPYVTLSHPEAYRIGRALVEPRSEALRVIPEPGEPRYLHLGVTPLGTSYRDIHRALNRVRRLTAQREFEDYPRDLPRTCAPEEVYSGRSPRSALV